MSYCRFSSDDGKSDVYVYSNLEGNYITSIARSRKVDAPEGDAGPRWVPVTLPFAGHEFCDGTAADTLTRLLALRNEGYHIPQDAIDRLFTEVNT